VTDADPHFLEWEDGPPLYKYTWSLVPHFSYQSYAAVGHLACINLTAKVLFSGTWLQIDQVHGGKPVREELKVMVIFSVRMFQRPFY